MNKKYLVIGMVVVVFIALLAWLFIESAKPPPPLPGQKIDDLGRGHVPIGEIVEYNSDPPTSGKHYEEWIRSGVYSEFKDDRNLVHSLEHGYIIMSYNCPLPPTEGVKLDLKIDEQSLPSADATTTTTSKQETAAIQKQCDERKNQLAQIYEKKGKARIIVLPRLDLDANFALTAWNYLDKFNDFDQDRIEKFIDAHLNQGPEKTMEQ